MKKKMRSVLLMLMLLTALVGCGNTDPGSIEEGRIIINGVAHTYNTDTFEETETKNTDNFDVVFYDDTDSLFAYNKDENDGESSSVLFNFNDDGTLYSTFITKGDAKNVEFSIGDINNESSFHDILGVIGLLENDVYTPHDTRDNGGFYSSHSLENGSCMVDWSGEDSGFISFNNEIYGYEFIINFKGKSTDAKNTISTIRIAYQ